MNLPVPLRLATGLGALAFVWFLRLPPGAAAATTPGGDDDEISLSLVDTNVRDALRMVAEQAGVNIVVSNKVDGKISLELENTNLGETLEAIASVGGFEYVIEGKLIKFRTPQEATALMQRVPEAPAFEPLPPPPLISKVLNLSYLDAERVEPLLKPMLSEAGSVSLLFTPDHVARQRAQQLQGVGQGGGVQQGAVNGANNAANGANALQIGSTLTWSSEGQPASSHTILVRDYAERVAEIERVVQELDERPLQLLIQTRFVEIALNDDEALGIDWDVLARASGALAPHTAPFTGTLGAFDPNVAGGTPGSAFPPAPATVSNGGDQGLYTFGALDFTSFTALLEMIQQTTQVQTVSNPRVFVTDRNTATILVGERFPILSANISEFGSVTEQLDRYEPIGVQLVVTPSVVGEDEIQLLVRPSTSSLGGTVEGSTGISVARINSRQIDTSVTVKDGQTVVLGGLITSRDTESVNRVPFLSSIPLLGELFTHRAQATERVDLVIFLTVEIVRDGALTPAQQELFDGTAYDSAPLELIGDVREQLDLVPSPPKY